MPNSDFSEKPTPRNFPFCNTLYGVTRKQEAVARKDVQVYHYRQVKTETVNSAFHHQLHWGLVIQTVQKHDNFQNANDSMTMNSST